MHLWFETIFEELITNGVRFVVVGGVAVNAHGVPRFTADIDLIVELEQENVLRLARCMTRLGFKPKVPVPPEALADPANRESWQREKNMRVFSFQHPDRPYEIVDIFVNEPMPFGELWAKKELVPFGRIALPVIGIDHLLQLKRDAGRLQDLSDIEALERLKEVLADESSSKG
jgi:hypothetical protein